MEFSPASLITGLIVSSIGMGLFLFGKKQGRVPQLIAGLLLMALPFVAPAALLQSGIAVVIVVITVLICRAS